MHKGEIGQHFD